MQAENLRQETAMSKADIKGKENVLEKVRKRTDITRWRKEDHSLDPSK